MVKSSGAQKDSGISYSELSWLLPSGGLIFVAKPGQLAGVYLYLSCEVGDRHSLLLLLLVICLRES